MLILPIQLLIILILLCLLNEGGFDLKICCYVYLGTVKKQALKLFPMLFLSEFDSVREYIFPWQHLLFSYKLENHRKKITTHFLVSKDICIAKNNLVEN